MLKRLVETHSDGSHEDLKQRNGMFLFRRNLAVTFLPRLWCHWKEQLINRSWIVVSLNMIHPAGCFKLRLNGWKSWSWQERGPIFTKTKSNGCKNSYTMLSRMTSQIQRELHIHHWDKSQISRLCSYAGYLKRTSKRTGIQFHDAETNPERDCKNSVTSPADQIGPFTFYHFSHSFVSDGTFAQSLLFDMNY